MGFDAIAFGNHEFDFGTGTVADLILPDEETGYPGTAFPYLSANLDFSNDENLAPLVVEDEQDGDIFGSTDVFLNGTRGDVRTQETNLGNLTADANLAYAQEINSDVVISIKNGGGIRDNIGALIAPRGSTNPEDVLQLPPQANELAEKEEGDISQLNIANSLRFNNGLTLLTVTADELLEIIEHGVSATEDGATPGQFPYQVAGIEFSFDADLPAGDRLVSLAVKDTEGNIINVVAEDGELVGDSDRTFRLVTLGFLADILKMSVLFIRIFTQYHNFLLRIII